MFLGAYHFELHVCVVRDGGLTVYDTCPSAEVFAA